MAAKYTIVMKEGGEIKLVITLSEAHYQELGQEGLFVLDDTNTNVHAKKTTLPVPPTPKPTSFPAPQLAAIKKSKKKKGRRTLNGNLNLSREAIETIVFNPGIVNQFVEDYGCSKATIQRLRARSGKTKAEKLHFIRQISKPTNHHKQAH